MEIVKIVVTDLIMAGRLFTEAGYDLEQSADNLAELKWHIIMGYLEEQYPEVEVYADIAIQRADEGKRPLEVLAYSVDGEVIAAASQQLQRTLTQLIAEASADNAWAVRQQ